MTVYTNQTLVGNVVYGVPSGNYNGSSQDWVSNAVPAANYYGGQGAVQTITYQLNGFVGVIDMQATLNDTKESAPWFSIANIGNANASTTGTSSTTVIGNFTWIRAEILEYTAGNIGAITVAY